MRSKHSGKASGNIQTKPSMKPLLLRELELTYCSEVESNQYQITRDTLKTAVNKIHLRKSPGRDLIIGYWFKKVDILH